MAPTTLDHMLDTYLDNATQNARSVICGNKTLVYMKFAGDDINGQGDCKESALNSLRDKIRTRVYRAMATNRPLPVIGGINITPSSF